MNDSVKQVLIWRNDVRNIHGQKVRTGKIAAQLAHASLKAILNIMHRERNRECQTTTLAVDIIDGGILDQWINGIFTKVVVVVDSEQQLLDIYHQAVDSGIICSLIMDSGLTEFGGVPTYTAVAIGPDACSKIDPITGNLKLL